MTQRGDRRGRGDKIFLFFLGVYFFIIFLCGLCVLCGECRFLSEV